MEAFEWCIHSRSWHDSQVAYLLVSDVLRAIPLILIRLRDRASFLPRVRVPLVRMKSEHAPPFLRPLQTQRPPHSKPVSGLPLLVPAGLSEVAPLIDPP